MTQITALPHLTALIIAGPDAAAFLQGQTTCDVREVTPERSRSGALCSAQGRVIATFRLLRAGESYLMVLSRDLAETVLKRLKMYVLRAKVEVTRSDWSVWGLAGGKLDSALAEAGLELSSEADAAGQSGERIAARLPGAPARCLLLAGPEAAPWPAAGPEMPLSTWLLADIANGWPEIGATLSEQFVPQMLNLDTLGAVSFTKGCYTGQEVVARAHYLGQVKRRMYRFAWNAAPLPLPGDAIYAPSQNEATGTVVSAAEDRDRRELLAVVATGRADGELRLGSPDGPLLSPLPLAG